MRRILAIPLLAAFWVGSPAYALTQDPDTRVTTMPVVEPRERTVAPRFREVLSGSDSPQPQTPMVVAEQRGQRGGGGNRGGSGGGGGSIRDGNVNRGGGNRDGGGRSDGGGNRDSGANRGGNRGSNSGEADRGARGGEVRTWDGGRSNRVVVVPRRPSMAVNYSPYRRGYIYPAFTYDPWIRHYYGWSPVRYAPWGWIYGTSGFAALGFGYNGYAPYTGYGYYGPDPYYGYGGSSYYGRPTTFDTGGVRLKVRPRDAQVFVDGSYAGVVNDFDGVFQELRLSQGGHKIEVRMPGFEPAFFDVYVQPGRTIDVREDLKPTP